VVGARRDGNREAKIRVKLTDDGAERFEQYVETLQRKIDALD
jgi:hypothetical protein